MSNKRLFVHLHIYYFDQVPYFVSKLKNITGCDWDLCVTYFEDNEKMFQAIKTLKPDAKFLKVKNIGYDIWPFIQAIRTVNLDDYDYILKLHTKAPKNHLFLFKSYKWRNNFVEFLLNSKKLFSDNIKLLDTNPDIGMVCTPYLFKLLEGMHTEESLGLNSMMKRLNIHYRGNFYNAVTMFIARSSIYKVFAESDISENDFNQVSQSGSESVNALILQRVLSLAVYNYGYKIYKVSKYYSLYLFLLCKQFLKCKFIKDIYRHGIYVSVLGKYKFFHIPVKNIPMRQGTGSVLSEFNISTTKNGRTAIFAGYCPDGRISDYQIFYLKSLKKVVDNIIFVADSDIFPEEVEKIKDLVCYCDFSRHFGYDFYSYKKGFEYAKTHGLLDNIKELVICNDSCYGAVHPFENSFEEMNKKNCDFWGYTQNTRYKTHIQSFFYVFKRNLFLSEAFEKFISRIKKEKSVNNVIKKYEMQFTEYLSNAGFRYVSYIPLHVEGCEGHFNKTVYPLTLIKLGCPLVKVKVFNNKFLGDIKEDSFETLDYVESINPELAGIIRKDNWM